ncbi:MAG TPA: YhdP family protein [Burkholderiales bacterium]
MDQPLQKLEQLEQAIEETIDEAIPPKSRWRLVARIAGWALVALYFVFAAALLSLRYWILPKVAEFRSDIEQYASKALGQRITIGAVEAGWQGLRPDLLLANVTVFDHNGRAALSLPAVEGTVSWISILIGAPRFYSLVFDRPRLEIQRDETGKFYVAGIELRTGQAGDAGMARWALSQREIIIRDASVSWDDNLRRAPPLDLLALNFVLRNGLLGHRFAFKAKPPVELASTLDVRGEVGRGEIGDLDTWTGRVYAELEYMDLVAWRSWVDYPEEIQSGKGGVRVWLDLGGKSTTEATADVALSQVVMRVAKDLPPLELDYLQGRLGASQQAGKSFEVFGRKLTLRTGTGIEVPPADFRVRWQLPEGQTPPKGEIEADAIELAPLARLAEYLPFPQATRARLAATDPRGSIHTLKITWTGEAEDPQHYSVRGSFSKLSARANDAIPGFTGLTGRFEASEKGGNVALGSGRAAIDLPGIFAESTTQIDSLSGQISWKLAPDQVDLGLRNLSVANSDLAATFNGSFSRMRGGPNVIDLTGNFSRAEGRAVYRYIPWLPSAVVEYLKASIRGGQSNDVRLRLKGDLAKFPFADPGSGIFQVVAKVRDANLRYAEGWPQASGISGDLIFEGKGMRVVASKAAVLNVQANSVHASIPDLFHGDVHVGIEVHAEDQTSDFLQFVAQSPVTQALDGVTEGMSAKGTGRLGLKLDIPIRDPKTFTLAGEYQIVDDEIRVDSEAPPFSQVNGRIEFTKSGITARTLTSKFLGGPATISLATRADGMIVVNAQGTASAAQLPRAWGEGFLRHVSGVAAWQGTVTGARGQPVTLIVQSQLIGIAADLPMPLGKAAVDPMPLRVERVISAGPTRGDTIRVSLDRSVEAYIQRRREGSQYLVERGVISVNEPAVPLDREGIVVRGNLPYADADRWRALLGGEDGAGSSFSSALDLKIAALDFGGRRLNDVALRAGTSGSVWITNIAAKELSGEIAWRPEGRGRIVARLKHFSVPEVAPGRKDDAPARDLPALDIIADSLVVNDKNLGRFELIAVNQALDWNIEKLVLTGPESTLTVKEGVWQSWALRPTVNLKNINLEVSDIGKYLERLGYPRTVQRGAATLKGDLSWAGSPQAIDYATLAGHLEFEATKGQFLKAEPGAARLIGVLSMQSLLTLDFRELVGSGFAFDLVSCPVVIANGTMTTTTKKFRMSGPSAQVTAEGQVDLVHETQDLHARVEPSVGDSLSSIILVAVNPVWGLGALILQKILRNPLGQVLAFDYHVTGTWTEPHIDRLKADVRTVEAQQRPVP